jgi:hypothetical protein
MRHAPLKKVACSKLCFLLYGCIFFTNYLIAQSSTELNRNIVYVEGATKGAVYSINYERSFKFGEKLAWSYRIGGFVGKDAIALPLGINAIAGKNIHHAEVSLVAIPYVDHYHSLWNGKNSADKYLYVTTTIGYRYQKPGGRLYFKVAGGPLLFLDPPSADFWKMESKFYAFGSGCLGFCF